MSYISNDFKIHIDGMIEALSSKGINFLKPREYGSEDLASLEWTIKLEEPQPILKLLNSIIYKDQKGDLSIRFSRYITENSEDELTNSNTEQNLMYRQQIDYSQEIRKLGRKYLAMVRRQFQEINFMNRETGIFYELEEYVYLPPEIGQHMTTSDINELEKFDKNHGKLEYNVTLSFDEERNIIATIGKKAVNKNLQMLAFTDL